MVNDAQIARAVDRARHYVTSGHLPLAALAVATSTTTLAEAGLDAEGREAPELLCGTYAIASISKAVTGVGVACLYQAGRLRYDQPVAESLAAFATDEPRRSITPAMVLTHSTGLPSRFVDACRADGFSADALLARLCRDPLAYAPGTRMAYTTYSYQLINGLVVARLGLGMQPFLQRTVFGPAGMTDTAFTPDPARLVPTVNHPVADPYELSRLCAMELSGGGLWSSLRDLVRLGQAWLAPGRLVSAATRDFASAAQPGLPILGRETERSCRTLGWVREPQKAFPELPATAYYHGGATGTLVYIDPPADLIFVFLTNRWGSGNDHAFDTLRALYT